MPTWLCDLAQSRLPKKTLEPSVIYSMSTGRAVRGRRPVEGMPFLFFLFKDVEKKWSWRALKLHTLGTSAHANTPQTKNPGISTLQTPTSPNHVAEVGAQVVLP